MVICPQVLQAGASLCMLRAAALRASRPFSARGAAAEAFLAVLADTVLPAGDSAPLEWAPCAGPPWAAPLLADPPDPLPALANIRTSLSSGVVLSYSVGVSQSSPPVLATSGLSSTCTRSVRP